MKLKTVVMTLTLALALSACGGNAATSTAASEAPAASSEAASSEATAAPTEAPAEEAAPSSTAAGTEVDVGGPYPATTDWDEYAVTEYYFAETDETVDMLVETNAAHDKFNVLFDFFGDKQEMTFTSDLTVEYDLTGFIGKDVEKINSFIQENITEWTPISADGAASETAAAGTEVDVGGPYPATTDWDEYAVTEYYFAETDETVDMLVETNTAHDKFNVLFDFFGDKQEMTFTSDLTVEYDLTGFIGKDVEKINSFIQENITEWKPIA